jgi:hypothetical protein
MTQLGKESKHETSRFSYRLSLKASSKGTRCHTSQKRTEANVRRMVARSGALRTPGFATPTRRPGWHSEALGVSNSQPKSRTAPSCDELHFRLNTLFSYWAIRLLLSTQLWEKNSKQQEPRDTAQWHSHSHYKERSVSTRPSASTQKAIEHTLPPSACHWALLWQPPTSSSPYCVFDPGSRFVRSCAVTAGK